MYCADRALCTAVTGTMILPVDGSVSDNVSVFSCRHILEMCLFRKVFSWKFDFIFLNIGLH